ncbi:MAG TPA: ABC transporter permease, partial [Anaerolineaceae bacterium]|nr:ABC transporter permease [Anaerolineaceae bacterium]
GARRTIMNIGQAFIEALESLSSNKLRSGLTILGIVIGVGAVIAMLAVGQGAQDTITGSISGIGTNLLFVFSGNNLTDVRNPKPLTQGDADALDDPFAAPSVEQVAPVIQGSATVSFGKEQSSLTLDGITPTYQSVRNYELVEGEFIREEHLLGQSSVVVIASAVADKLFGRQEGVVGETIRIENQPFRVIGVLKAKGGSTFGSADNFVMVPITTAQARLIRRSTHDRVDLIFVKVRSAELVRQATDEVSSVLRARHRVSLGADDFTVLSQQDFVNTARTITGVFTIFLGGVAAISLLVGGIGIMNIMLVSVTERTREIGLRKALGARRRDILIQFLTESALLSLLGGVVGILLGYLIAMIVGKIAAANGTPFYPQVEINAILLATLFSTAVGLFFGLYPANRAASLQPLEALRSE